MGIRMDITKPNGQVMNVFSQCFTDKSIIELVTFDLDASLHQIVQKFDMPSHKFKVDFSSKGFAIFNICNQVFFKQFLRPEILEFLKVKAYLLEKDLYFRWLQKMEEVVNLASKTELSN